MASKPPTPSKRQLAETAVRLAQMGDWEAAQRAFLVAIDSDRRNAALYFNLSLVEEQRDEIAAATAALTLALSLKPSYEHAARRLSRLLARFQLDDVRGLSPNGLKAALLTRDIAHQPIVDAALSHLFEVLPVLKAAAAKIESAAESERETAASLLVPQFADDLGHELLSLALRAGIVKLPSVERVLTGLRAAMLLNCSPERFEDRRMGELALSLVMQGWNNDHAWAQGLDETAALAKLPVDKAALLDGDREASRRFMLHALYRQVDQICDGPISLAEARRLKPRSLREVIEPRVVGDYRRSRLALSLPSLKPLSNATSIKVAGQYELSPYPRWQSLHISQPGSLKQAMARFFSAGRLSFMDKPFDVLIAGTGTGQQALQAASAYGPQASLVALDLSRSSLGYAAAKAEDHAIRNVAFIQGDILDVAALDHLFDVIECVGVLHHMTDPWAGWRALVGQLKPGGLMYIGLYSAVSRSGLKALRNEPEYPASGCSDAAARRYRRQLLDRANSAPGGGLKRSRDFYALHAFRDLALHESEQHTTLGQIEAFLDENELQFHGFTIEPQVQSDFEAAHPGAGFPGRLADWSEFELANPMTFDAMYRFWVGPRIEHEMLT